MCSCTILSRICPRCAISFEDIQQHCPVARANGELCANRHLAEIPGHPCARCKERGGEQLSRFGHRVGHAARASVSSLKSHLHAGGRARAPENMADGLITVRYEHTHAQDPFVRDARPHERAKVNRQTQWPSFMAAKAVPAAAPERPRMPARSAQRQLWSSEGGGDSRFGTISRSGASSRHGSPLPPVLPDLELPPRTLSPLGSPSELSDSSSVYSQDSLPRER